MNSCPWCLNDPLYQAYHDNEWGVPAYDCQKLFAFLLLEGMQAGLSWLTILKKREHFYQAFDDFDPNKIANYGQAKIEALMQNASIIRNRLKINAIISNAKAYLAMQEEGLNFSDFIWSFVNHKPIQNHFSTMDEIPAQTAISIELSKALKIRGFGFVGPTIIYAFMQACGLVNDHLVGCYRHKEIMQLSA